MRYAGNQSPDGGHFFAVRQLRLQQHGIGNVGHHHHDAVHRVLFVAHRAQADRKMAHRAVASFCAQFEVFHLMPVRRGLQRRFEICAMRGLHPVHQPVPDQFALLIARFVAAAVRVTDQSGRIEHQDHALRGVQDFLVEVSFALQLRLKGFLLRDVQHQPADLHDAPPCVVHGGDILQRMQPRSILPAQRFLVIAQNAFLRQRGKEFLARFRSRIEVGTYVRTKQFFPRCVAQHSYHRIVYVQKAPFRHGKKQAFLNAVK